MAARQASQSNAMLYSLITFIALFLIATVFAVIYYVKSEEYRTQADMAKEDLRSAVGGPMSSLQGIVGKPEPGQSYLKTMQKVVDDLYSFVLGRQPADNLPATVKFNEISMKIDSLNKEILGEDTNPLFGPDGVSLIAGIEELKTKLDNARVQVSDLEGIREKLESDLKDAREKAEQDKQSLLAQANTFQTDYDNIRNQFDQLKQQMQDVNQEQIQDFQNKLDDAQAKLRQKQLDLQKTEEQLNQADKLLDEALTKLEDIKPKPDKEVQAYQPDAQIVRVDLKNGIVILDAGVTDYVYRGLTFALYDRNKPIPEEGKGKAEIEVFQVSEQVCAARIVESDKNNPVVKDDIVANLIWDRNTANRFVVSGEFDFNNDGLIDPDGAQRIVELIERWGGQIDDEITVDTDFLIVGSEPQALQRPTQQELNINPLAQQRYEISVQKVEAYNKILEKAANLGIPVFNQKRFMYLIGYDTLIHKNPML